MDAAFDLGAAHADYVLAAYALMAAVWVWCLADTWLGARRARRTRR